MTAPPFKKLSQINNQQDQDDMKATAHRFDALFYGSGSQFRKMLDELDRVNPRASSAFQRLGEIQMASGSARPWLVLHHASSASRDVVSEICKYIDCPVDTLDAFWQVERLTTIERLHDYINARLEPPLWGLAELGYPEIAKRWSAWQSSYCAGIRNAHSLTRAMPSKNRRTERLHLCIDNLNDHLDDLRDLFRDMREVTGPGGWWGATEVVNFLGEDDQT